MKQEEICLSSTAEWNAQQDINNAPNGIPIPKSLSIERSFIWLNYGEENQVRCLLDIINFCYVNSYRSNVSFCLIQQTYRKGTNFNQL